VKGSTMEGGRGNDSFTVVEVLKPQGFKEERSDDEMVSFPREESIENRGFSKSEASDHPCVDFCL